MKANPWCISNYIIVVCLGGEKPITKPTVCKVVESLLFHAGRNLFFFRSENTANGVRCSMINVVAPGDSVCLIALLRSDGYVRASLLCARPIVLFTVLAVDIRWWSGYRWLVCACVK